MKIRLLILSMLVIVYSSQGQTIFVKFGPSLSKVTWTSSIADLNYAGTKVDTKSIIGFNAITGVNYLSFKYFYLSSGIGLIQKGSSETAITLNNEDYHRDTSQGTNILNYFTLNTTFNIKILIKQILEPYIFVGPKIDYLFSYSEKGEIRQYDHTKINKLSYGILYGGGINFNINRIQLGIVFEKEFNINKLVDEKYISIYKQTYKYYDNTFTIDVFIGVKF
jgi:hypothetical protein